MAEGPGRRVSIGRSCQAELEGQEIRLLSAAQHPTGGLAGLRSTGPLQRHRHGRPAGGDASRVSGTRRQRRSSVPAQEGALPELPCRPGTLVIFLS